MPPSTDTRTLFGTDGVRGEAGTFLSAELATSLGRAATTATGAERPQVLIVRDTRESGPMLEAALAAGVAAAGGDAFMAGVLPTPAASILTRRHGFDMAAVVSASHNPYADNGIKFFGPGGTKMDDETEGRIEGLVGEPGRSGIAAGRVRELRGATDDYLRELGSHYTLNLAGKRVILDCANGATHRAAPTIFERLGADVEAIATQPDGRNINENCGSTHPELLAERVVDVGADVGFAFDGDGDRLIAVDGTGRVRDGDELIALAAAHLKRARGLAGVVVTVMTNYGFHAAMEEAGIPVATTKVGDRYVLEELRRKGWELGGEQSGHIIDMGFAPTGDGIAAALLIMEALGDAPLADAEPMSRLPQTLINVRVADRSAVNDAAALWQAVDAENAALEGRGRVLVRPSGTEPLVRVMVEAPEQGECEQVCSRLVALVEQELG